jgi:3-hydroxybutyryl-CoA dehydrogenase
MTAQLGTVTVLGTGVLGSQIAYQSAYCGYPVTAHDVDDAALGVGRERITGLAERYEREVDGAAGGAADAALTRIRYTSDLPDAARDADLVIEAIPEILDLKREVFAKLGAVAPERTIFATNSSTRLPSALADSTGRPDRFLALHFANEIWSHNIAEVMGHASTDPAVYAAVVDFARSIGMEPIELKKEQPGYVLNTLTVPFLFAALGLLVDDVAEPEMVDKTWRISVGASQGPFQMMDVIGLRTAYNIAAASPDEKMQAAAALLKERYIDQGKLGRESGEGFYSYPAAVSAG